MSAVAFTLHGLGVSSGIAIGRVHLVSHALLEVPHYEIPPERVAEERTRLKEAVDAVRTELRLLRAAADQSAAQQELDAFIDLQILMLDDPMLIDAALERIAANGINAEWALAQQLEELLAAFDVIDDAYLRERRQDVIQTVERLMKELRGLARPMRARHEDWPTIIVAHDLSPADTIGFRGQRIGGFLTDVGSPTSHTAIVARSLKLPAVVGVRHARQLLKDDELVIIDARRGVAIANPPPEVVEEYRLRKAELDLERTRLARLKESATRTLDGTEIQLHANIESPKDLPAVRAVGADGIGLYRTEFLFTERADRPSEAEQFEAYREVVRGMKGKPVTIRTFDLGADKDFDLSDERRAPANPALGLRGIRYCLAEPAFFLTQLRALLRAAACGPVKILLPMVMHASEIDRARQLIAQARSELVAEGVKVPEQIPVGAMIEVPAAAIALPMIARRVDFLSIGTNDLIQYTLAIDRQDDAVAELYDPLHPAVLRLLAGILSFAARIDLPVSLCGELAGDPDYAWLLAALGLREFSMHPERLLEVRQRLLYANLDELAPKAQRLVKLDDPQKIREAFARFNDGAR
ncbi:phosphoenolpyruvate-protein phosphotransferase [Hydrogenophilus thermoluteolus]|uniref:phosphoenolpyruvate--protein phosphotransferase n=1 Tax=Hydrogenophilus thermoluteolus TaxID=297 RepID=UPI0024A080B2|nr:phosphoenolpyruvate--protein phosphotransferase [Hydrogenophilus thermoluteolus]GLW60424.1 phosphoenolpyruvate-protein phosphotransferase [Hydrogenophilus thermoluteolus]